MLSAARAGAVLASAVLMTGLAAPSAPADDVASPEASPSPVAIPAGLYGRDDPTYDGVWRQSLALLALHGVKVTPAKQAVSWLTGQQCADGGWPSFRADTVNACTSATEDSNATSLAVQALVALGGHRAAVDKGVAWIKHNQNPDGGWSYNPGGTSDANSTGLSISALVAAKARPAQVQHDGVSAYGGLAAFQLGCKAPAAQRGAFAAQPGKSGTLAASDLASAQATLAAAGGSLPVDTTTRKAWPPAAPDCAKGHAGGTAAESPADAASYYLIHRLATEHQRLIQSIPGSAPTPDFTATSWAVLSLVAAGHPDQAADAADWLAGNGYSWTQGQQGVNPSAAATLVLVARATKLDPYNFGGTNLVQLLIDSGPAPAALPAAAVAALSASPNSTLPPGSSVTGTGDDEDNGGFSPVWLAAVVVLVGVGGAVLKFRGRRRRHPAAASKGAGGPAAPEGPGRPERNGPAGNGSRSGSGTRSGDGG